MSAQEDHRLGGVYEAVTLCTKRLLPTGREDRLRGKLAPEEDIRLRCPEAIYFNFLLIFVLITYNFCINKVFSISAILRISKEVKKTKVS